MNKNVLCLAYSLNSSMYLAEVAAVYLRQYPLYTLYNLKCIYFKIKYLEINTFRGGEKQFHLHLIILIALYLFNVYFILFILISVFICFAVGFIPCRQDGLHGTYLCRCFFWGFDCLFSKVYRIFLVQLFSGIQLMNTN